MRTTIQFKTIFSLLFILAIFSGNLYAQRGYGRGDIEKHKEKIESHKIAFITEKLKLTPAEAEKFWPVYHENMDKIMKEREDFRSKHDFEPEEIAGMDDKTATDFLDSQLDHEKKMIEIRKAYYNDLKSVLSPQKILQLVEVEKEFKVELMRKVSRGRSHQPDKRR